MGKNKLTKQQKDERSEFLLNLGIITCAGLLMLTVTLWIFIEVFNV